jgi:NADPH2:quinone reductase
MRAARIHELGKPPQVDDVDAPEGSNVVDVSVAALNPVDVSIGSGRFYGGSPDTPYVIGSEAVGTLPDGRRVWFRGNGTVAELSVASPDQVFEVEDDVSDEIALVCGVAGLTGWLAVAWRAKVTADDTVLVLGASGTVGSAALQGAKVLGARRVIGAARKTADIPDVADEVVSLDGEHELPEATVVIDPLWGEPAERALAAAAHGVRFVQLGQSASPTATLASGTVRGKAVNILGLSLFSIPRDVVAQGHRELSAHVVAGRIRLDVETYPLDDVATAWERQASGSPGAKILISA